MKAGRVIRIVHRLKITLAGFLILTLCQVSAQDLPDIGEPSLRGMSYAAERRLGEVILAEVRANLPVVEDIELNDYLYSLGLQLATVRSASRLQFHFILVRDPAINAFATPGGVVAINSGLIIESANESQLAGVVAHEITHIDRRHLPRMLALHKDLSWVQTLVAIVGIMTAVYNPALGSAGLHLGTALPLERQLSYTRAFEREADRYGLDLMAEAGFDPRGMVEFFQNLHKQQSAHRKPPEFLLTHPLTEQRLADAQRRAQAYRGDYRRDSRQFQYAKARLLALSSPRHYALGKSGASDKDPRLARYRRAVALTAYGNPRPAVNILRDLHADKKDDIAVGLAYMQALLAAGRSDDALRVGQVIGRLYPHHESVVYYRAKALVAQNRPRRALDELTARARNRGVRSALVYRLMAELATADRQVSLGHEFFGDYYTNTGRLRGAIEQYKIVLADKKLPRAARARVEIKKKQIEDLIERMRKR